MRFSTFGRQAVLLFVALRAADLVNLAGGLWIVPKFVATDQLGAVLPLVTFATTLALPAFAFAFVLMREANRLARDGAWGALNSLLRGSFLATLALFLVALAGTCAFLPRMSAELRVHAPLAGYLAIAAACLGCFAPIYMDALNALARFGAYGAIEIAAALVRLVTLLAAMPFAALPGFFLGNAVQPLVRIAGALLALRGELHVRPEPYWTADRLRHHGLVFLGVLVYLASPLFVSLGEQTLVRTALSDDLSAGYYLLTRLSDMLNYLTLPLLLVLFPHAAEATRAGRSTTPLVWRCTFAALVGAVVLGVTYHFFGETFLRLFPNLPDGAPASLSPRLNLPLLLVCGLLTAAQTFYTNAEIAAGRFRFLRWFVPLHLAYAGILAVAAKKSISASLTEMLLLFGAFAAVRTLVLLACARKGTVRTASTDR